MNPIYKFEIDRGNINPVAYDRAIQKCRIDTTNGELVDDASYWTSALIPIPEGNEYCAVYKTSSGGAAYTAADGSAFYDEDGTFISGTGLWFMQAIPQGAAYLRFYMGYYNVPPQMTEVSFSDNINTFPTTPTFHPYVSNAVYPVYNDDAALEWAKENGEYFFRRNLSGDFTFTNNDYDYFNSQSLSYEFLFNIYISYDRGRRWELYWSGHFYKTDCRVNDVDKYFVVTPKVKDGYTDLIAQMDKEVDLIETAPEITPVIMHRRPIIQFYIPETDVVGCCQNNTYWEQECEPAGATYLNNTLKFGLLKSERRITLTDGITLFFHGTTPVNASTDFSYTNGNYSLQYNHSTNLLSLLLDGDEIAQNADYTGQIGTFTLTATQSGFSDITATISDLKVYGRMILDVAEAHDGTTCDPITDYDFTDVKNYGWSIALGGFDGAVKIYYDMQDTPTQMGKYMDKYYTDLSEDGLVPMIRNEWNELSIWCDLEWFYVNAPDIWNRNSHDITLKECYPLCGVFKALFAKLNISLDFEETDEYSAFFYGSNPVKEDGTRIFLTPKSNALLGDYDEAAKKSPITLKSLLTMLRNMFNVAYFVEHGKFRLEHISWFIRGGSYTDSMVVGRDLTAEVVTRNGKPLCYGQSLYSYDKPELPQRYEFKWMEDVTPNFEGSPLESTSPLVEEGQVENVDVSNVNTDVDYMQSHPNDCSKDGLAVFACIPTEHEYDADPDQTSFEMPLEQGDVITEKSNYDIYLFREDNTYITVTTAPYTIEENFVGYSTEQGHSNLFKVERWSKVDIPLVEGDNRRVMLQNGYLRWKYLQNHYLCYNMPPQMTRDGSTFSTSLPIKYKKQEIEFPCPTDINIFQLVKTSVGEGQIEKISINLSSRNGKATLKYEPQ